MNKAKDVKYRRIREDSEEGLKLYSELRGIVLRHHKRRNLDQARFCLVWQSGIEPDQDDRITLGKCRKASDFDREFSDYDFVIILNRDAWERLDDPQRRALLDHELCHAAPVMNTDGTQKEDTRSRRVWRIRRHDIEEFAEIMTRHGCWKQDLEAFVRAALASPTLFTAVETPAAPAPPPPSRPAPEPPPPAPADDSVIEPPAEEDGDGEQPPAEPIQVADDIWDKALYFAISKPEGATQVWGPLIKSGASMVQIAEAIAVLWREPFTWPPAGQMATRAEVCVCQARPPRVWIGVDITEPPTFSGSKLIDAVRRLLAIGEPAAAAPEPSAAAELEREAREDPEHWRNVKLQSIEGLGLKNAQKLSDVGLDTLGQLNDWLQPNGSGFTRKLTDVPGIGEAKAQQIEEALTRFWEQRNRPSAGAA